MSALDLGGWPVGSAAAAAVTPAGAIDQAGPQEQPFAWASVTKVLTALTCWVAVEEGTLDLDAPAGPPGATVRHLLAHASGLNFDDATVLARPGERRIYSNRGIELVADALADAAGMPFETYLADGVLGPLGMVGTRLEGSPAAGAAGPVQDLARLARELLEPTLVSRGTLALATAVAFPGLAGVLPGFGRQEPNDWGLGVEVRGTKSPHWMPPSASPRTFGHFGQSGAFLWIDPDRALGLVALTDRDFGDWAPPRWHALGDAVISAYGGSGRR